MAGKTWSAKGENTPSGATCNSKRKKKKQDNEETARRKDMQRIEAVQRQLQRRHEEEWMDRELTVKETAWWTRQVEGSDAVITNGRREAVTKGDSTV